ncbi:MAG: isochorismate synthase MenF [bacterium]
MGFTRNLEHGAKVSSYVTKLRQSTPESLIDFPTSHRFLWKPPQSTNRFLSLGCLLPVKATGIGRFGQILKQINCLTFELTLDSVTGNPPNDVRPRFNGGFSFYNGPEVGSPWNLGVSAYFWVPKYQVLKTKDGTWLTQNRLVEPDETVSADYHRDRLDRFQSNSTKSLSKNSICSVELDPDNQQWKQRVNEFRRDCSSGDIDKIVPAQHRTLSLERPLTLSELHQNFTLGNHKTYRFLFQMNHSGVFAGASPEQLLTLRGRSLESVSIAGTIGSGESERDRQDLANELSNSRKDSTKYLRNKLAPFSSTLETVPQAVKSYTKVQHLVTALKSRLKSDCHVLELVERIHPTPAVCGHPTGLVQEKLKATESFDRGFYAAPVGWFDQNGNGEFSVAIRSALVKGNIAHTFAGAGVISESSPQRELEELELKFDSIHSQLLGNE